MTFINYINNYPSSTQEITHSRTISSGKLLMGAGLLLLTTSFTNTCFLQNTAENLTFIRQNQEPTSAQKFTCQLNIFVTYFLQNPRQCSFLNLYNQLVNEVLEIHRENPHFLGKYDLASLLCIEKWLRGGESKNTQFPSLISICGTPEVNFWKNAHPDAKEARALVDEIRALYYETMPKDGITEAQKKPFLEKIIHIQSSSALSMDQREDLKTAQGYLLNPLSPDFSAISFETFTHLQDLVNSCGP